MDLEKVSDPLTRRVLEFVDSKGGPSDVARAIGKKPALFYLLVSGHNKKPSTETLNLLAKAYDDFKIDRLLSAGTTQLGVESKTNESGLVAEINHLKNLLQEKDRVIQEKDRIINEKDKVIQEKDRRLETVENDNREYVNDFRVIAKQNFLESDNHVTDLISAIPRPLPIGYVLKYMVAQLSEVQKKAAAVSLAGMEAFCQGVLSERSEVVVV